MRIVSVDELKGGEYLAKPVIVENNRTLFYEGTCLYMKHIENLLSLGIESVSIFEPKLMSPKEKQIIKKELHSDCSERVKLILESRINIQQSGMQEISEAANEIIDDIYSREEIVDRVYDIKERSGDLYDHCVNVAALSILVAVKMNMSKREVYDIGIGSLLHDMGLRYLSVDYRDCDMLSFTPESMFEYKKHTLYGFSSVEKEFWMSTEAKMIILSHHERLDGSGYPFKQKVITSLGVRIVSIVDAFDDILCGIGCLKGNVRQALDYIKEGKDKLFDGRLVNLFLEMIAIYPVGTVVVLNTKEVGIVIEQNDHNTDKPKLRMTQRADGTEYPEDTIVNLAVEENRYIDFAVEDRR